MNDIERMLKETLEKCDDETARRNFRNYRVTLDDVQHYIKRLDELIFAMLKDARVDFRALDDAEQEGGDFIYQCLHGACDNLQSAHTRMLRYYQTQRGADDARP